VPVGFDANARPVRAADCRLFTGVRSDPFFADAEGFFHAYKWTSQDTFAGKNILSIALEAPDHMLVAGPEIGVWTTVGVRRDGMLGGGRLVSRQGGIGWYSRSFRRWAWSWGVVITLEPLPLVCTRA
jgi:Domain of unknown function (DUF4331)